MFLHSLLRSPDLLAAGSTGSIFKGRRNNDLRFFSPERTQWSGRRRAPWALNNGLLQEMPFHLPTGFFWWTLEPLLQETGAVSFLVTSLMKRRVLGFCDPVGAGCVRAGCPGAVQTGPSQPHGLAHCPVSTLPALSSSWVSPGRFRHSPIR